MTKYWFGLPMLEGTKMAWGANAVIHESGVLRCKQRQETFDNADEFDAFAAFLNKNILPWIKKAAENNYKKFLKTHKLINSFTRHFNYEGKVIVLQMKASWRNVNVTCSLVEADADSIPAENYPVTSVA